MDLPGHEYMTRKALDAFAAKLPPRLKWLRQFLDDTVHHAVNRDVLDVITFGHWTDAGQRHHFMRAASESETQAYVNAVKWIQSNALDASRSLRKLWKLGSTRNFNPGFVAGPLGYAFHALQDSYSAAHIARIKVGSDLIITGIHVYDEQNQNPHGSWPGHNALDKQWNGARGQEAIIACRELARIVVAASLEKEKAKYIARWAALWKTFVDMFLKAQLRKPAGANGSKRPALRH